VARDWIADDVVRVLGRPPDLRVVLEAPPVTRAHAFDGLQASAALARVYERPALLALARA